MKATHLPDESHSFWYETGYRNTYPALHKNVETEVAVIGGGIAGILTAYSLIQAGRKVTLLEGRELVSGTTGYTTAKLSAQHQLIYDELINRYGNERAKLYYEANMEGIASIKSIAEKHDINAQIEEQDSFVYTQDKSKSKAFEKEAAAYDKLGIAGGQLHQIPTGQKIETAIKMEKQAQMQPVTFLHQVLDVLKNEGAHIFEHTLIVDAKQEKENEKIKLQTEKGHTVTCADAVFATHYPLFDPEKFFTGMDPEISYALALKTTKDHQEGMYINEDLPKRTFRSMTANDEKYLLVGGQSHPIGDDRAELERYKDLYEFAKETFGDTEVVYRWSSHDLITKDRIPLIGQIHPDYPNMYALTGFSKWGLANAATGANIIADLIAGEKNRFVSMYNPHRDIPDLNKDEKDTSNQKEDIPELDLPKDLRTLKNKEATIIEKDDEKIGVYKDDDGKLHHLNLACTHLGCGLNWNNGDRTWDCPCHGSRFAATGEVIQGPAHQPLEKVNKTS